jgi:hypothetical protein
MPGVIGPIGLDWKVAGTAPVNVGFGPITDDWVMRPTNTGAFQGYKNQNEMLTGSTALKPPALKPIAPTSTVGGMAIDLRLGPRLNFSARAGNGRLRRRGSGSQDEANLFAQLSRAGAPNWLNWRWLNATSQREEPLRQTIHRVR